MHYDFIIAGSIVKAVVDTHERLLLSVVFIAVFIARNKGDIAGASVLPRLRKCNYRGTLAIATFCQFKSSCRYPDGDSRDRLIYRAFARSPSWFDRIAPQESPIFPRTRNL